MGDIVTGLISYWTLDSTLVASVGGNLTYGGGGSPAYEAGQVGNAGVLDGAHWYDTGVTNIGGIGLMCEAAESFSVSAWLKTSATGIVVAKAGATVGTRTFALYAEAGLIKTNLRGQVSDGVAGFTNGAWHHLVFTWNGGTTTELLYGDNSVIETASPIGTAAEETTQNIILGARTGGAGFLLTGSLDDVRIYNRALAAADVTDLFNFTGASAAAANQYYRHLAS